MKTEQPEQQQVIFMDYDAWFEKYNPPHYADGRLHLLNAREIAWGNVNPATTWTMMDNGDIVSGIAFVNRFAYILHTNEHDIKTTIIVGEEEE